MLPPTAEVAGQDQDTRQLSERRCGAQAYILRHQEREHAGGGGVEWTTAMGQFPI